MGSRVTLGDWGKRRFGVDTVVVAVVVLIVVVVVVDNGYYEKDLL